jgi:hypothetical protein
MNQTIFEASRQNRAFHSVVTAWGFQLKTGARCPGLRSNRTFKSATLADAAGLRMQAAIADASKFSMHVQPRTRDKLDHEVRTWGYMLTTGPRCGGVLSVNEYKSYELAESAARRMAATLQSMPS